MYAYIQLWMYFSPSHVGSVIFLVCVPFFFSLFYESHRAYESPWGASARKAREEGRPQYVTFEPDHGGFNNIRCVILCLGVFSGPFKIA